MNIAIETFDDFLNAILVKELRQTVRGKFFWSIFNLFLAVVSIVVAMTLTDSNSSDGASLAGYLLTILYFTSFFLVPLYIGKKVDAERKDGTNELLSITTMTPQSIVKGKFLCGLVIVTMLYCAFAPFMFLVTFLGGIDTFDLFVVIALSYSFCMLGIIIQVGVGMESIGVAALGVATKACGILLHICLFVYTLKTCLSFLQGDSYGFTYLIVTVLVEILIGYFVFSGAVSTLQPDSANKSYTTRKIITIIWALCMGSVFVAETFFEPVCVGMIFLLGYASLTYHKEPEGYSERIVREIPANIMERFLKFPFYTGTANGFAWVAIVGTLTIITLNIANSIYLARFYTRDSYGAFFFIALATINAYGFIGNSIRKLCFKSYSKNCSMVIGAIVYALIGWLPLLLINIVSYSSRPWFRLLVWTNPVIAMWEGSAELGIVASIVLLLIALGINSGALLKQTRNYFELISYEEDDEDF